MIKDLLMRNRSYRRFDENVEVPVEKIESWVEAARYTASMRNVQPLKYILVTDPTHCEQLCRMVHWAGYLTDWDGPEEGERPRAFLVQVLDSNIAASGRYDEGLQLEAITLSAIEDGFGCCIMLSFSQGEVARYFDLPDNIFPLAIVAIGKPAEKVVLEDMQAYGDYKYYHDENGVHHVPKRKFEDLVFVRIYPQD